MGISSISCFHLVQVRGSEPLLHICPLLPAFPLRTQLHCRIPPVFTVIVALPCLVDPRSLQPLLLVQERKQAEDNGTSGIELHFHQAMADRVRNVLEVHSAALDQSTDSNNRVEWLVAPTTATTALACAPLFRHIGQVRSALGQEVRRTGQHTTGGVRLRLRRGVHPLYGIGELIGARDGLDDNVLVLDAGGFEGFTGAREEGLDDFRVPPPVDDSNAEV